jgi:hypothetical protein
MGGFGFESPLGHRLFWSPIVFLSYGRRMLSQYFNRGNVSFVHTLSNSSFTTWCHLIMCSQSTWKRLVKFRKNQSNLVQLSARSLTFCIFCQGKNPKLLLLTGSCKVENVSEGFPVVEPTVPCARTRLTPHQACLICKKKYLQKKKWSYSDAETWKYCLNYC